ncbi:MAG: DNA-directed RNA polymerase subunit omega [Eubacterium sp.]|nr:DNA-directed RNA polymerase subunit omega [Eubacterium sp.]
MIHPSYSDLMKVVNSGTEFGEEPVVNSRYSIVIATAKRARQIIAGDEPMVERANGKKPLSIAVEELNEGKVKILAEDATEETEEMLNEFWDTEEETDGLSESTDEETDLFPTEEAYEKKEVYETEEAYE